MRAGMFVDETDVDGDGDLFHSCMVLQVLHMFDSVRKGDSGVEQAGKTIMLMLLDMWCATGTNPTTHRKGFGQILP